MEVHQLDLVHAQQPLHLEPLHQDVGVELVAKGGLIKKTCHGYSFTDTGVKRQPSRKLSWLLMSRQKYRVPKPTGYKGSKHDWFTVSRAWHVEMETSPSKSITARQLFAQSIPS